jgi:cold shock CspA family protein
MSQAAQNQTARAIAGKILRFDPVKGFGALTADDGRELPFDVGICRFTDPRPGEVVRFQLGPSRLGGERVVWVERADDARRLARATMPPPAATLADEALMAAVAASDGDLRLALEELVRRRATHFRVQHELTRLLEKFETCRTAADISAVIGELRELWSTIRPE